MPRRSEIRYRELMGLVPKSKMRKDQIAHIENNNIKPDQIEYYFGRRCEYWKKENLPAPKRKLKRGDTLVVIGKRWFDRGPGNTYHSCEIIVNGETVQYLPFQYGYEDAYKQTAQKWLAANYIMPKKFDERDALWRLRDHGITINFNVTDVSRKKDL